MGVFIVVYGGSGALIERIGDPVARKTEGGGRMSNWCFLRHAEVIEKTEIAFSINIKLGSDLGRFTATYMQGFPGHATAYLIHHPSLHSNLTYIGTYSQASTIYLPSKPNLTSMLSLAFDHSKLPSADSLDI